MCPRARSKVPAVESVKPQQLLDPRAGVPPLLPEAHSHSATDPTIQIDVGRGGLRLAAKGGKYQEMLPAHHKLVEYLDAYVQAPGIGKEGAVLSFGTWFQQATERASHVS